MAVRREASSEIRKEGAVRIPERREKNIVASKRGNLYLKRSVEPGAITGVKREHLDRRQQSYLPRSVKWWGEVKNFLRTNLKGKELKRGEVL